RRGSERHWTDRAGFAGSWKSGPDVLSGPTAVDEAVEHIAAELTRRAVDGHAVAGSRHLIDEVLQAEIEVILDQREGAQANAGGGAGLHFLQRRPRRALVWRIHEHQVAAFEMSRRLAVGDADDLLVGRGLLLESVAGKAQAGLDVGEVLRHE